MRSFLSKKPRKTINPRFGGFVWVPTEPKYLFGSEVGDMGLNPTRFLLGLGCPCLEKKLK